MNDVTEKTELVMFAAQCERLCGILQAASAKLRNGDDPDGIDGLLSAMSELEKMVENDQQSMHPQIELQRLVTAVKTLLFYIMNKDIAAIADLLEDVFYPMAAELMKGNESI